MSAHSSLAQKTFSLGDLVEIHATSKEESLVKGKLAVIASKPETVELGDGKTDTAYAVKLEGIEHNRTLIVLGSEIAPAPESDRYDDDKLTGDIISKRATGSTAVFAVKLTTGEIVIKTKPVS